MKRLALSILFLLFAVSAVLAQNISVKSFASDPTDLTARMNPVKDEHARNCALLKIITTETGFSFQPDLMGICKDVEYKTAEIWVWLAPGSRRITIAHPQLGQLRNYEYPEPIEASSVYVMELTTAKITTIVEEQNKQNFLRLSVSPADALVKIDGSTVVTNDGQYAKMLPVGQHTCECYCPLYYPEKQDFTILPDEKTTLNISLKPNYGYIKVTSAPESSAAVFIDGRQVGTTPYTSDKLESKGYTVQVAKEMWQDATQQVTVADNQTSSVSFTLLPNFAEPVFACSDAAAEIWINGEKKGTGRWSGRLPAGAYRVEAKRAAHAATTKQITLANGDNSTIALDAPTPIYGKISVNSDPFDADILLDGTKVGTTPELLNNILIGSHEIKLQKQGCTSVTRTVTVKEGETAEVTAELATGRQVMLKSDLAGTALYIDGSYAGTAPYSVALSFGSHTIKAVNDGVTKEETITVSENGQSEWTLNVQKGPQTETITVNGVSFKMIAVKGGTFTMGCTSEQSDCDGDESPAHKVTLSDYCMGETEVTQALWKAVMGRNPSKWTGDNLPVENVSWNDVQKFIRKLNQKTGRNFRLPTEAEWEYAARGGSQSRGYQYSGSNTLDNVAWYDGNSGSQTHPVKTKQPNELGLYDMSGNVWEWCADWWGSYSGSAQTNPTGPGSGSYRVNRGGGWLYSAGGCRVSNRFSGPGSRGSILGFRLAY